MDEHRDEHGLNRCLAAIDLHKGTYWYRKNEYPRGREDDRRLKEEIVDIIEEQPAYGWRRILPELEERTEETINYKRLKRLLDEYDLKVPRQAADHEGGVVQRVLDEASGQLDLVTGQGPFEVLEVFSTDFTELRYDGGTKKARLCAMVDIRSRWVPGWAVGRRRNRQLALTCWQRTKSSLSALDGRQPAGRTVHQDRDSVFTSHAWLNQLLIEDEVRISYSENGAEDNPWVESLWSRTKDEMDSRIREAASLNELQEVIDEHFTYYNHDRRHSSVDYKPPAEYLGDELDLEKIPSFLNAD